MLAVLVGGTYAAYKHFSGLDPLKLDPVAVFNGLVSAKVPKKFLGSLPSLNTGQKILGKQTEQSSSEHPVKSTSADLAFRFLIVADSHNDNGDLSKAIAEAKQLFPDLKFIIGLGDYTDVGTLDELKKAKEVFDSSSLRYFLVPGDHDLWDCRNRSLPPASCFTQVFGPDYQTFDFDNFKFLLLNNSDNYAGFSKEQSVWISNKLEKTGKDSSTNSAQAKGVFVFLHEPLYHPSSDHVMGWVEKNLKPQAGEMLFRLKDAGILKIFSGHIHYFSEYEEPRTNVSMVTIGAVTIKDNPQAPRFGVVSVFEDGSTKVEDVEIK